MGLPKQLHNMTTIVTHNGSYHCDELFASALFAYYLELKKEEYNIVRTRDQEQIEKADIVIDVGGEYDPLKLRFDHHQLTFTKLHEKSAIKMASMGIVFDYIIGKIRAEQLFGEDTKHITDDALFKLSLNVVRPIDAHDNGIDLLKREKNVVYPYDIEMFLMAFKYNRGFDTDFANDDEPFFYLIPFVKMFWKRTLLSIIAREKDYMRALEIIDIQKSDTILFPENMNAKRAVEERPSVKFMIQLRDDNSYNVTCAFIKYEKFARRVLFPESWRGLREGEFSESIGLPGAKFCHKGGQFAIVKTEEDAWELVRMAKDILGLK